MRKRVNTKRLFVIVLVGIALGTSGVVGVYLHGLHDGVLFHRQRQLRFCGRCGYQEWYISTRVMGFDGSHHARVARQKNDFAGIDQSACEHVFFSIGINDAMIVLPDFDLIRSSFGTLSNDLFFERPILVETYRTLERENRPGDAGKVFSDFIIASRAARLKSGPFKWGLTTNVAEALNGNSSQALVQALYKSYGDAGEKLGRDKQN
jgi:hypothetical protein